MLTGRASAQTGDVGFAPGESRKFLASLAISGRDPAVKHEGQIGGGWLTHRGETSQYRFGHGLEGGTSCECGPSPFHLKRRITEAWEDFYPRARHDFRWRGSRPLRPRRLNGTTVASAKGLPI